MIKRTYISYLRSALLLMVITSSLFPLITFADTVTLSPNGIGNFDNWTLGAGATKYSAVSSNDGDTSYISGSSTGYRQTFTFPGASVPGNSAIGTVTIYAVAMRSGGAVNINLIVARSGTTTTDNGADISLANSYGTHTRSMVTNPFTGVAWTASEVNSWNSGGNNIYFGVRHNTSQSREARVTQISVVVDYTQSTAVTLLNFNAGSNDDGSVMLAWETATETDNAGFNIYRSRLKDGNYKKLNSSLIPSKGNEVEGSSYSYEDTPPASGAYYYKLEDVDYNETTTMHGPEKVRVRK